MPPWKRHKFELGGGGGGGGCCQSCPPGSGSGPGTAAGPARPGGGGGGEGPLLGRVGRLFRSKRRKLRVSREAPTYSALYLGHAATLQAKGDGCTEAAVGRIWAKSQAGRRGTPMKLSVGPQGLRLAPAAPAGPPAGPPPPGPAGHLYVLPRVTYCAADPRLPRLFAWVYRHEGKHKAVLLRCHAALLARARQARALALLLAQTAAAALADFRRLKKRADARRLRPPLLAPGPPARTHAPRPPAAAAGPPRKPLPAISEDWLGEERERERQAPAAPAPAAGGAPGLRRLVRDLGRLALRPEGDDEEEQSPGSA